MAFLIFILIVVVVIACCVNQKNSSAASQRQDHRAGQGGSAQKVKVMRCPTCGATLRVPANAKVWECGWCRDSGTMK